MVRKAMIWFYCHFVVHKLCGRVWATKVGVWIVSAMASRRVLAASLAMLIEG